MTNYYKQDVYDKGQKKVGKIDDVLIDKSGDVTVQRDSSAAGV